MMRGVSPLVWRQRRLPFEARHARRWLAVMLSALPLLAAGQTVYRSVDADGLVTYSTRPVDDAVESTPLTLPPGPSEAQKTAARERLERDLQRAEAYAAQRRDRQSGVEDAGEEESIWLEGSSTAIGEQIDPERAAELISRARERHRERIREEIERRREEGRRLPGGPVHIQPVPRFPNAPRIQPVPSGARAGSRAGTGGASRAGGGGRGGG